LHHCQDIDSAIKEVERKEAEKHAVAQAAEQRKQEEEAAKAVEAEKEARARRAEAERVAQRQIEEEQAAREARESEERGATAARGAQEERAKVTATKGKVGAEWQKWVGKQRSIKSQVIEPVKADRAVKTGLRTGMRLITRGLGQVVNTKEGVMRVVSRIQPGHATADHVVRRTIFTNYYANSSLPHHPPLSPYASILFQPCHTHTFSPIRSKLSLNKPNSRSARRLMPPSPLPASSSCSYFEGMLLLARSSSLVW